jgi:hypothetical protein
VRDDDSCHHVLWMRVGLRQGDRLFGVGSQARGIAARRALTGGYP